MGNNNSYSILNKITAGILLLCLSVFGFGQTKKTVLNKIKPPYNIKEYYLLLPDSLLDGPDFNQRMISLKYKNLDTLWKHKGYWLIDTLDYKNGYLKLSSTGDGSGTEFEITYFIKKDKSREIAVNTIYWDLAMISSSLKFYSFKNNTWKDITKKVLPEIKLSFFTNEAFAKIITSQTTMSPVLYKLPQKGKNITAKIDISTIENLLDENTVDEDEYVQIKKSLKQILLIWNNGVFKLQN